MLSMMGVAQASALNVIGAAAVPVLATNNDCWYEPLVRYTVSPAAALAAALARLQGVARVAHAAAVVAVPVGETYQSAARAGTATRSAKIGKLEVKASLFILSHSFMRAAVGGVVTDPTQTLTAVRQMRALPS